jgi:hypothetical protein
MPDDSVTFLEGPLADVPKEAVLRAAFTALSAIEPPSTRNKSISVT